MIRTNLGVDETSRRPQGQNKTRRDIFIPMVLSTGLTWEPVGRADFPNEIGEPKAHNAITADCTHEGERLRKCAAA